MATEKEMHELIDRAVVDKVLLQFSMKACQNQQAPWCPKAISLIKKVS